MRPPDAPPPPEEPPDDHAPAAGPAVADPGALARRAEEVLHRSLAGAVGHTCRDARELVTGLRDAGDLWKLLPATTRSSWQRCLDVVMYETADAPSSAEFRLDGVADRHWATTNDETLDRLRAAHADRQRHRADDPAAELRAFKSVLQRRRQLEAVDAAREAILRDRSDTELADLLRDVQPPSDDAGEDSADFAATARELNQRRREDDAASAIRISSGLPLLDAATTNASRGEPRGSFGLNEFWVFPAPTGSGKSAFVRARAVAAAMDLRYRWGLPDAKVLLAFTEEDDYAVREAMRVLPGDRFQHLADNIVVADINASRRRLVISVYRTLLEAKRSAAATGRPIRDFLPYMILVDYLGGVHEQGENEYTDGLANTADLCMRGFAPWDFEMMARFGGVSYEEWSGEPVPAQARDHRVAVLGMAQLKQRDSGNLTYREPQVDPSTGRVVKPGSDLADFTKMVLDEDGNPTPGWKVYPGDVRLVTQDEVKGVSKVLDHATMNVALHRSRPDSSNTPVEEVAEDGSRRVYLPDTRARLVFLKNRKSVWMNFVPLEFNSDPEGRKATFYDTLAINAMLRGDLTVFDQENWEPGDPMIPPPGAHRSAPATPAEY